MEHEEQRILAGMGEGGRHPCLENCGTDRRCHDPRGVSISEVGWPAVLGTAALAGVTSLLTSVAGLPELKGAESDGD